MVVVECVDRIVGCDGCAIVCIGLNSPVPNVGGNTEAGMDPGNVGDTTMNNNNNKRTY